MSIFIILMLLSCYVHQFRSQSSCNRTCETLRYSSCFVCFDKCSDDAFQMVSCTHLYCSDPNQEIKMMGNIHYNPDDSCQFLEFRTYTEQQCTLYCCDTPPYESFNQTTFDQCKKQDYDREVRKYNIRDQNNHQKFVACIVLASSVGVLICTICCGALIKSITKRQASNNRNNSVVNGSNQSLNPNQNDQKSIRPVIEILDPNKQWRQLPKLSESRIKQEQRTNCSICLSQSPNCQTSCGHKFHLSCIYQWIYTKFSCPLCLNKKLNPIKVVCVRCKNMYFYYDLYPVKKIQKIVKDQIFVCQICKTEKPINTRKIKRSS